MVSILSSYKGGAFMVPYSCQCSLANLFAPVTIKSKTGAVIRSFSIEGVNNLETVSEFIWREMFLSMLASGKERHEKQVSEMLDEIQQINGWAQLVRILRGGKKRKRIFQNLFVSLRVH